MLFLGSNFCFLLGGNGGLRYRLWGFSNWNLRVLGSVFLCGLFWNNLIYRWYKDGEFRSFESTFWVFFGDFDHLLFVIIWFLVKILKVLKALLDYGKFVLKYGLWMS